MQHPSRAKRFMYVPNLSSVRRRHHRQLPRHTSSHWDVVELSLGNKITGLSVRPSIVLSGTEPQGQQAEQGHADFLPLQVGGELVEFKYDGLLFSSEGRMEREIIGPHLAN